MVVTRSQRKLLEDNCFDMQKKLLDVIIVLRNLYNAIIEINDKVNEQQQILNQKEEDPVVKKRKCSLCGEVGHARNNLKFHK